MKRIISFKSERDYKMNIYLKDGELFINHEPDDCSEPGYPTVLFTILDKDGVQELIQVLIDIEKEMV